MVRIRLNFNQFASGFVIPFLVLLAAVAGYFYLLPKYRELKEQKQALAKKQVEVSGQEAQLGGVKDLIADLKQKEAELLPLDEALPTAPAVPQLLANLEALTSASGLLTANLQLTLPSTVSRAEATAGLEPSHRRVEGVLGSAENLAVLQIDLIVKGQYLNLKTFLSNLEQNMRLLDILSLTFTPVEKETGAQDYALRIQTYYHKAVK